MRVFKGNEISRGFKTIRFLAFLCTAVLCRNFSHVLLMKVDLFIIQLENRTEFYEKEKTLAERKRDRAKQFHRLVRVLHNRAQTRGQE